MMPKMDRESGLAYGFGMIFLYLISAVLLWMGWAEIYDTFLAAAINPALASGSLSLQTANAISWNVNIIRYCIPVVLIFGLIFAVNYAVYKTGGNEASFQSFYLGFLVFLIFTIGALFMAFFGGMIIDVFTNHVAQTLPMQNTPMATQMQQDLFWFVNLYYLVCDLLPVLGGAIWGQSILKKVRTGVYQYR
jgi:hypothetical protein